jgi:hypothetical protein
VAPSGEVHGTVADEEGQPLARAQVRLMPARGGARDSRLQAETDSAGAFTLRGVSPGRWDALVTHLGHGAVRRRIDVRPGTDTVRARLAAEKLCLVA